MRWIPLLFAAACAQAAGPPPKGLVLVSLDTVRPDRTALGGAPADKTPSLARFAEEAAVFERAYSAGNETLFAHASTFTSKVPSHTAPVNYDFTIPDGTATLASQLKGAGWATGAVVAGGHLARVFGVDDGFDTYTEAGSWGSFQESIPMALRWVDERVAAGEPFFLFVHGYDAHAPYVKPGVFARLESPGKTSRVWGPMGDPLFYERIYKWRVFPTFPMTAPENARGTRVLDLGIYDRLPAFAQTPGVPSLDLTPDEQAIITGAYASAVFYTDLWIGVLMHELRDRGLLDTTTVALMSDHGEALMEHGFANHRHTLRDVSTHVMLAIRKAGGQAPSKVSTPVSLLDLAPTLLELAGAPKAAGMEGRSLVPCLAGDCPTANLPYSEAALGEVSVTDGQLRLVVGGKAPEDPTLDEALRAGEGVALKLYDVADGQQVDHAADPARQADVARLREALLAARGAK